jgi:N-acetylglutamate synthase-like GNAT family acetyltransferase
LKDDSSTSSFVFHENPCDIDLAEISKLLDRVHMRARPVNLLSRAVAASTQVVVVTDDKGTVVGFGRLISDGVYYGTLWDIAVHPDVQRQGIGLAIVARILKKCEDLNLAMVGLFTEKHNRTFYERIGFKMINSIHAMTLDLKHFEH